jgi:hypothetical protein
VSWLSRERSHGPIGAWAFLSVIGDRRRKSGLRRAAAACAALVIVVGAAALAECALGLGLGIDLLPLASDGRAG